MNRATIHADNPSFSSLTFCGRERVSMRLKVSPNWRRVNCGTCIAIHTTDETVAPEATGERGEFWVDNGEGRVSTVWEKVGDQAYAIGLDGRRLEVAPASWINVAGHYGPLRRTTLADVVLHYARHLETRLYDGNL